MEEVEEGQFASEAVGAGEGEGEASTSVTVIFNFIPFSQCSPNPQMNQAFPVPMNSSTSCPLSNTGKIGSFKQFANDDPFTTSTL